MPGQQLLPTWWGNRAELLAAYALSSFAAVTHVRREDDYGLDLLCTLISQERNVLRAGRSFGVQAKSVTDRAVRYGGLDKHGAWKGYEIEWLFSQDQPILIATADIRDWHVRMYSTINLWHLGFQIGPNPGEVILMPDEEIGAPQASKISGQDRYQAEGLHLAADGRPAGNGFSYRIPLGKPIVDISADAYEEATLVKLRMVLDKWVERDYQNIIHRNLKVPYILEWQKWTPNEIPENSAVFHFWSSDRFTYVPNLLDSIAPALQSLMLNLNEQNDIESAKRVIPLADWLRANDRLDGMGLKTLELLKSKTGFENTSRVVT